MRSVLIQSDVQTREILIAELWEAGTTGIIENESTVRAFFDTDTKLAHALNQFSHLSLEVTDETTSLEMPVPAENADPIYAGQKFFIVSSWINSPTPPGRYRLTIDANNAFGSGSHESTQLVIQALEEFLTPGSVVLDVGCGSGILSEVAHRLGAGSVFACDTHLGALDSARQHSTTSYFFAGSIDALKESMADVVIVNISATVIDLLAAELHRVTKPGRMLILAGFIGNRPPTAISPEKTFYLNGWSCWLCRPEDIRISDAQRPLALQPFPEQWW